MRSISALRPPQQILRVLPVEGPRVRLTPSIDGVQILAAVLVAGVLAGFPVRANEFPTIVGPTNLVMIEDVPLLNIPFRIADAETPAERLRLFASLIESGPFTTNGLALGGSGEERTLSLRPEPDQSGPATIRLRSHDAWGWLAEHWLTVLVQPVNDPVVMRPLPPVLVTEGEPAPFVQVGGVNPDGPAEPLTLRVTSSRPELVAPQDLTVFDSGVTVGHRPGQTGSTVITAELSDGEFRAEDSFVFTVVPAPFRAEPAAFPSPPGRGAQWMDLDADGTLDLLMPGEGIFRLNDGQGGFGEPVSFTPRPEPEAAAADFDGDGDLDLLLFGDRYPQLLVNQGGTPPRFVARTNIVWPIDPVQAAAWGDLDGDGDLDLLISNSGTSRGATGMLRQVGPGEFRSESVHPSVGGRLATADFDGDGDLDVAVVGISSYYSSTWFHRAVGLWANDGRGSFPVRQSLLLMMPAHGLGWVDVGNDGEWDLWVAGADRGSSAIQLFRQSAGNFASTVIGPFTHLLGGTGLPVPTWGDFDHDGLLDFVLPINSVEPRFQTNTTSRLFHGRDPWYRESTFVASNRYGVRHAAGDFDRDGRLDLAECGTGFVLGWRNESAGRNLLPSAPGELQVWPGGPGLWLQWLPTERPLGGAPVTYNVRVGTHPGGQDLVASMSTAAGHRLLPAPGNAGFNQWLRIEWPDPMPPRIYWSVQAVDRNHRGGPFAPERVIQPRAPARLDLRMWSPDLLALSVKDASDRRVRLQESTDLMRWETYFEFPVGSSGEASVALPLTPTVGPRFFRVKELD
ncbi:MAG: FG-GAP repeat domain-containing protein [Limisphaerales bacterium]